MHTPSRFMHTPSRSTHAPEVMLTDELFAFHAHTFAFDTLFNACANILDILIVVVHINRFVPSLFIFANIRVWFKIWKNLERTTY